ncbi:hypothetical protein C8R43DRAFT_1043548 [Mycena crocata]|nr:hypothetical protein C8R43DRAFT_1043548 [Mycena crocata]
MSTGRLAGIHDADEPQGIHSIPPELISLIFSFTHHDSGTSVHSLARVCRFWRSLSHSLPELWTDIRILHCRPGQLDMINECLRRSNALPVQISFAVFHDVVGNQLTEFWAVLLKIWSVHRRWRKVRIETTDKNFWTMLHSMGRKDAPLLECLELVVSDAGDHFSSEAEHNAYSRPSLSLGVLSALKSLTLKGIALQVSAVLLFVEQLETLDLSSGPTRLITDLAEEFCAAAEHSNAVPRLRHLSIRSSLPALDGTSGSFFASYISSLTTLTLGDLTSDLGASPLFFTLLRTPLLEELTLDHIGAQCWEAFTTALRDESLTFPSLRTLNLYLIEDFSVPTYLDTAFPALERLSLRNLDLTSFFSRLSNPFSPGFSKPDGPIFWPRLHALTINNASYRDLRPVVEARIALGCPLAALEVDTPRFVDMSALRWLQSHVGDFKRHSPV